MSQASDEAFYEREYRDALSGLAHYTERELSQTFFGQTSEQAMKQLIEDGEEIFGKCEAPSCPPQKEEPQSTDEAP